MTHFYRYERKRYKFNRAVTERELLEVAQSVFERKASNGPFLQDPQSTANYITMVLGLEEREIFAVLLLDNRHRLIKMEKLFFGTIDGASVYPREVVKIALKCNASAVILAHNHPSGVAEPSRADEAITVRIKDALSLVDIRTLDHIITGSEGKAVSFVERGLI